MTSTSSPRRLFCDYTAVLGDLTSLGPLKQGAQVLVVGDGNFAYSRAFLYANSSRISTAQIKMTVTSLDSKAQLLQMYPISRTILEELHSCGVYVRHEVNATKLESYSFQKGGATIKFDRIVFNFSHYAADGRAGNTNKRNKIHRHRQLLLDFFASASQMLAHDGQIWVTLCAGQGGTKLEKTTRPLGETWQIAHCAAAAKLVLQNAHYCPIDALADLGYYSVGYHSREKAFRTENGITHVFFHEGRDRKSCFPIEWTRDVSFWVTDEQLFTENLLLDTIRKHFPIETMAVSITLLDEFRCGKSDRKSVTYRLDIASSSLALSRDRVNALAQIALAAIENLFFGASRAT